MVTGAASSDQALPQDTAAPWKHMHRMRSLRHAMADTAHRLSCWRALAAWLQAHHHARVVFLAQAVAQLACAGYGLASKPELCVLII